MLLYRTCCFLFHTKELISVRLFVPKLYTLSLLSNTSLLTQLNALLRFKKGNLTKRNFPVSQLNLLKNVTVNHPNHLFENYP